MKKLLPLIFALITFGINAQVVVKGIAPSSIAGVNYNFEWADPAGGDWSTPDFNLPNTFVQDSLELVVDNSHTGDNPVYAIAHPLANEGCLTTSGEQYTQPSLEGKIAVVWRGSCQFGLKAALAENNGAVGIIIINHSGDPVGMAGGDSGTVLDIPVVMISTMDGQNLLSLMENTSEPGDPSLLSVSPASAIAGQNLNVTIKGENTNFDESNGTSLSFSFEQGISSVNSFEIVNNTTLKANITVPENAQEGSYDITTNNATDGELSLTGGFNIISSATPASLVSISPSSASPGETLNVTITGENTHFNQGSGTSVSFSFEQGSSSIVNSYDIIDDLTLKANISVPVTLSEGTYDFSTSNSVDGELELLESFVVSNNTQISTAVEIFMGNKQDSQSNDIGSTRDIANGPKYGSIPLVMANNGYSFDLGLTVTNFGTDDNVGIVKQNINGPSGEVYSDSLNLGVIKSDSTIDTLYQTVSGIEYENGEYNIEYTLLIDGEADGDPSDNIIASSFNVTDDVLSLARTDELTGKLVVNSYPRNAETYYQTCIHLREDFPYTDPAINGVHLALEKADSSVGGSYIQVQVWEWNDAFDSIGDAWANVTFDEMELIKNQDYICPDNSLNGEMVYVQFTEDNGGQFPVEISDNQRYLVCLVTEDTDVGFGYDNGISYSSNYSYYNQPITALYIDEGSGGGNNWYTGWTGNDAPSIGLKLGEFVDYTGLADKIYIEGLLYPNPSVNKFKLNLSYVEGPAEVKVHDITGKVVKLFNVNNIQSISSYDISELNNGQYIVSVRLENGKLKNFNLIVNK